jgi:mannose-1-phosphate guanylyltransferase/mannose-6-phosphate isomerase
LQLAALRVADKEFYQPPIIVCNQEHYHLVINSLNEIGIKPQKIVLEREAKDTAPAAMLAAIGLDEQLILILPADHLIEDLEAFNLAIRRAKALVGGDIAIFGVRPTTDHSICGFGYILPTYPEDETATEVASFLEKPILSMAKLYISQQALWNSGMFMMKATTYLKELALHRPDIALFAQDLGLEQVREGVYLEPFSLRYCPKESIDKAIIERSGRLKLITAKFGLWDIGKYSALYQIANKDGNGNVVIGDNIIVKKMKNCYINASPKIHSITLIGVEDLVVVEKDGKLLIAHINDVDDIKQIAENL